MISALLDWLEHAAAEREVDQRAVERDVYTGLAHRGAWQAFRAGRLGLWDPQMAAATLHVPGAFVEATGPSQLDRWSDDGGR